MGWIMKQKSRSAREIMMDFMTGRYLWRQIKMWRGCPLDDLTTPSTKSSSSSTSSLSSAPLGSNSSDGYGASAPSMADVLDDRGSPTSSKSSSSVPKPSAPPLSSIDHKDDEYES
jgi:hypothetical protein